MALLLSPPPLPAAAAVAMHDSPVNEPARLFLLVGGSSRTHAHIQRARLVQSTILEEGEKYAHKFVETERGVGGGKRACIGGCEIRRDARADTLPPATPCKMAAGVCVPRRDSFFAVSMRWWTT